MISFLASSDLARFLEAITTRAFLLATSIAVVLPIPAFPPANFRNDFKVNKILC